MNARLKKRGLAALIIYFLMITALSTPIAFFTGKARGAQDTSGGRDAGADLSQNETNAADLDVPISLALAPDNERPLTIGAKAPARENASNTAFGPRTPSRKPAALRDAALNAIVGDTLGSAGETGGGGEAVPPLSLALAPGLNGGLIQGGAVNPGAGFPGALIPGFLATNTGGAPGTPATGDPGGETPAIDGPPAVVTPVPAALPLMLTGFAGLFAMGRRARI